MAKLRKWAAYRKVERPYTRWSKARKKAFVKSRPGKKVIKFDMGDIKGGSDQFPIHLQLISKDMAQIRTNALEAARQTVLRKIEAKLGRVRFYFRIRAVPHQVIRENPLAAGAGADRLSTGMKHSFGKIIGTACQVQPGKVLYELYLPEGEEQFGREMLKCVSKKLPVRTTVQVEYREAVELTAEQLAAQQERERRIREQEAAKKAAEEAAAGEKKEGEEGGEASSDAPAEEKSE